MKEKVKISKEQARAIEIQVEVQTPSDIITTRLREGSFYTHSSAPLNGMDLDTLIRALYIGYEVEQTPEDEVRDYYDGLKRNISRLSESKTKHEAIAEVYAITKTLNLLRIKIEGVNT